MIQQSKVSVWLRICSSHAGSPRFITHTIEADFTAANNRPTVTFSLFALQRSDVWCCAQQVVLVYQDYIIGISSYPWLLIVLKILLAKLACTLVISTRPTINLHATGERASVNFGHCLCTQVCETSFFFLFGLNCKIMYASLSKLSKETKKWHWNFSGSSSL